MAEVTTMELKVDLECPCSYKKIKKVLCKIPQIRNQAYDEKENTVTITIKCCCPEKIREKLWLKGGKIIKCIKIKEPPPPSPPSPPPPSPPSPPPDKPARICCGPCYGGYGCGQCSCYYYYYGYVKLVTLPPSYGNCCCGCGCGGNRG